MAYRTGKIRGYGACNDNAVGLMGARQCRSRRVDLHAIDASSHTGMYGAARELGVPGPLCMQNDYSIVNRRVEENGLSEASSPALANAGFMAYNVLAGGPRDGVPRTPSPRRRRHVRSRRHADGQVRAHTQRRRGSRGRRRRRPRPGQEIRGGS